MNELKREVIHIVKTDNVQDFKDEHEINNQVYLFTKTEDFKFGEWSYTEVCITEMQEVQKTMQHDETGVIFMSESNIQRLMDEYFPIFKKKRSNHEKV